MPKIKTEPIETPYVSPFIVKKIKYNNRDVYVIRVSVKKHEIYFKKYLRKDSEDHYSAWVIPEGNVKYLTYTHINEIKLGQLGTEFIDYEEDFSQRRAYIKEAHEAICLASKKAVDATPRGSYLILRTE